MTGIQKHLRIAGAIHIVYGAVGLVAVLFAFGLFVALAECGKWAEFRESSRATLPWVIFLVVAGGWYVFNIAFGRAARLGRPWATGRLSRGLAFFDLLLLPAGSAMGIYWLWILRKTRRPEPTNPPYFQPVA